LFGLLGIFPPLCDRKIGQRFKKCQTDPPIPKGMMGMSKGKGERRRNLVEDNDYVENQLLMAFNALSSDEKKQLLIAIEEDDAAMVGAIVGSTSSNSHSTVRQLTMKDNLEPTPEELFGLLGIFPPLCDRKIGQRFTKCQTDPPVPKSMMGMSKGKGERRLRDLIENNDDVGNELAMAFNLLSYDDKKRLLIAIEHDDAEALDMIFK
jgi:hypothetical protein